MSTKPQDQNSVLLVSNDNHTFILRKSSVMISPAIKSMLDKKSNFEEAQFNRVVFKNMKYRYPKIPLLLLPPSSSSSS